VRALQVTELSGPDGVELVDLPEPEPSHMFSPGEGVVVEVAAAAVSFPDVLQSRGLYQFKPDPPFVPGAEVAGVVRSASEGASFAAGDRVAAFTALAGWAELAVAPPHMTFPLPQQLDFAEGAALILNYHTAYFSLKLRGRLAEGERVLVHGAAGGVGTATLQVAKGLGASTVAVVSSDEKERVARDAGADEVVRSDGAWREEVKELTGDGVDVVVDPVGGDRFVDSLRCLREEGRLVVVGFTEGSIPEVKVNRLLLRNTEVVGAGWGAFVMPKPNVVAEVAAQIDRLIDDGFVRPIVGARFPLEQAADAMRLIEERQATGKVVLDASEEPEAR
jgi:NADPH:quinone reductase